MGVSGLWQVDTLREALLVAPLALPLAAVTVGLLRVMALGEAGLAAALLGGPREPAPRAATPLAAAPARDPAARCRCTPRSRRSPGSSARCSGASPGAALLARLGLVRPGDRVALHARASAPCARPRPGRGFRARRRLCSVVAALCVAVLGARPAAATSGRCGRVARHGRRLAATALIASTATGCWGVARAASWPSASTQLTRTRRGALDVQAAELRRIERDLHDGAQARLVALSMQLGRAEERLADQPEVADARAARRASEASAAIAELRDLARGIAPPVLADRGLAAAVEALGRALGDRRSPSTRELDARPPPVVETAAYFVVAEALTNVAKHAPGARRDASTLQRGADVLRGRGRRRRAGRRRPRTAAG